MIRTYASLQFIFLLCLIAACRPQASYNKHLKVSIEHNNGKYSLYRNGKPYHIKGASGYSHLRELAEAGGNTIRVWDTAGLAPILEQANRYNIAVIIGIPLPESRYLHLYDDKHYVTRQFNDIKQLVNRYKDDPAVLMWCVGNELVFPVKPAYNNFYKSFNGIVDLIHQDDPHHPVTTTMVNFQEKEIVNISTRTDVDLISFNIFSKLNTLREDMRSFNWFWKGPFLITEWAIDGPWKDSPQSAWAANIEPTSTQKAADYLDRYQKHMPTDLPNYLGSFIFFWGQKQETTHTWFSLFDDEGNKTEVVQSAAEIWTGVKGTEVFPQINEIRLDGRLGMENIIAEPGKHLSAELLMTQVKTDTSYQVKWEVYPEDWHKKDQINNIKRPPRLKHWTAAQSAPTAFTVPEMPGPYRLFASVKDEQGHVATANIPFYVVAR